MKFPNQKPTPGAQDHQPKKPFYKRWWFWLIIVLVILGGFMNPSDKDEANDAAKPAEPTTTAAVASAPETTAEAETPAQPAPEQPAVKEEKPLTVKVEGTEWACEPTPQDVIDTILEGEKTSDGANVEVLAAQSVRGVDNLFTAMHIRFTDSGEKEEVAFSTPLDGMGAVLSQDHISALYFNWPKLDQGPFDAGIAAEKCLSKVK